MRKGLVIATAAGLAALVTGSANAADKLKVGVTATLEGTYTVLGEDGMRGYDLAVEAHGGKVAGREIETIVGVDRRQSGFGSSCCQEACRTG